MKRIFKKKYLILISCLFVLGFFSYLRSASNIFTDLWTINGTGSLNNTAIAWIDSSRDFTLYDGDTYLGGSGSQPSTTAGTYPGHKVPIKNCGATAWAQGTLVVAETSAVGCGKTSAATIDQTGWLGISEGVVASGAMGYITTEGWALALTTGTVNRGDTLVSTGTVAGYLGSDTTPTTGADVAVAESSGTAAGGLTLVLLR